MSRRECWYIKISPRFIPTTADKHEVKYWPTEFPVPAKKEYAGAKHNRWHTDWGACHKRSAILISLFLPACSTRAVSVTFEDESGTPGSDWAVSNRTSPAYITITTGITGSGVNNPSNTNRVATYTVTFPAAGTYQLYARVRVGPDVWNDDSMFNLQVPCWRLASVLRLN